MAEIAANVKTSITGLSREFDLIAHNLANVSTPGFKRRVNDFSKTLVDQTTNGRNDETTDPQTAIDFTQGNFIETGRALDMALCGKGFFVIETPEGPLYTRNGMFRLNENKQLVDLAGRIVAGQNGPIAIPESVGLSQISVTNDGTICGNGIDIGKFRLVDFQDNQHKLTPVGLNCFQAPVNVEPEETDTVLVKQGFQEGSNVQMIEELVDMIMVSRLYEANMKLLSKSGDTTKNLLDVAMS
jgi:flagellar basal-body rod protein FlgF